MSRVDVSSRWTILHKFLPAAWICGFVAGTLLAFFRGIPEAPLFLVCALVGSAVLLPLALRSKFVELDDRCIYLRGIWRELAVPYSEIVSVQQKVFTNIKPAFIVFRDKTKFGKWILFIPKHDAGLLSQDTVVQEIRLRAGFSGEWREEAATELR